VIEVRIPHRRSCSRGLLTAILRANTPWPSSASNLATIRTAAREGWRGRGGVRSIRRGSCFRAGIEGVFIGLDIANWQWGIRAQTAI